MKTARQSGTIVIDVGRCVACLSCEMTCAKVHAGVTDIVEALLSDKPLIARVQVIARDDRPVPIQCRHCADAPCVAACSTGALYRDKKTGHVLTALEKCIKCKACVRVCPYCAVWWNERHGTIVKCDLCRGIVADGKSGPQCVPACPTSALRLADEEEDASLERLAAEYDALMRDESRVKSAGPAVTFAIDPKVCICCGRCAKECPVQCITGKKGKPPAKAKQEDKEKGKVGEPFKIDQEACVKCGTCFEVCPADAVNRTFKK